MNETKKWYLSKTIVGVFITALGTALRLAGFDITDDDMKNVTEVLVSAISIALELAGILTALYGRVTATKVLK